MPPRSRVAPHRAMLDRAIRSFLAVALLAAAGCTIVSISGPTIGFVGQILGYQIVIEHDFPVTLDDTTVWLMAEIPAAWSVADASYSGDLGSGTPSQGVPSAADPFGCFTDEPAMGYQRVFLAAGPFAEIVENDQGTVDLDLQTAGDTGAYTLRFRVATESGPEGEETLNCTLVDGPDTPVTSPYEVTLAEPIPALGGWGLGLLALLLAGFGLRRVMAAR